MNYSSAKMTCLVENNSMQRPTGWSIRNSTEYTENLTMLFWGNVLQFIYNGKSIRNKNYLYLSYLLEG